MAHYFYDENKVRYNLVQTRPGKGLNWLFLPGGPGADSRYFMSLVQILELPGNVWLIDLPGNGDNVLDEEYDYDRWLNLFTPLVSRFENPVCVGHSFGGMLPLLFPEMENYLHGFVALNSAPSLWLEEAVKFAQKDNLPDLTEEMKAFTLTPNQETFEVALNACFPYYFPKETLEKGNALLSDVPFRYQPAVWWQHKAISMNFSAQWIPQNVPMLVLGGSHDYMAPFSIYENDQRFQRPNVKMMKIEGGGHLPWVEKPETVREAFANFCQRL